MRPRTKAALARALWLVTFGCCAAGLGVTLAVYRPLTVGVLVEGAVYAFFFVLGFATVGLVVALRRPGNPIGWLYGAAGLAWAYTLPVAPWVEQLIREQRPLPLVAQVVAAAGTLGWAPAITLGVTLPALLLPNGQLRSRRWRLVVVTSVTGAVLITVAGTLSPGPVEELGIDNPLGLAGTAGDVAAVLTVVGVVLHWLSLPPAAVCVVLRFRSSRGIERQQMRWVAAGAAGAVGGLLVALPGGLGIAPEWISGIVFPALLCPPVAIGVAVLRYRLWDLDRLISRTVTYALVTALLVVPYLLVVPAASRLAEGSGSLAVAAATLAVAALFQPLRRRVRDLVDRRFNRRRYDARTLDGFAARLRDQVDLDALEGELLGVVDQTMQPTRASLWLRHAP
ncbi:MAG TPA: hypothetical protein VNK73_10305 [Actinomycetota bacterium]|nr:hypothetical protein [Actinomycetota bacterium]